MNKGRAIGGPICDPIRDMIRSRLYDGVIFHCKDDEKAERTRTTALLLKRRNGYDYRTMRRGNRLFVYKGEYDPDTFESFDVVVEDKKGE